MRAKAMGVQDGKESGNGEADNACRISGNDCKMMHSMIEFSA